MQKQKIKLYYLTVFFISIFSCKKQEPITINPQDFHDAVDKVTEIMIHDVFSPPVASRIYVYPNIAAYEVLNFEGGKYVSLTEQLNGLETFELENASNDINKKLASLIAYLDVAKELVFSKIDVETYRDSLYQKWSNINVNDFESAKNYGLQFSGQIINWLQKDGYKETRNMPDFTVHNNDPSRWQPTPPAYMKAIEPNWNKIRTFVLDSAAQFKPIPPPNFSLEKGSMFYNELMDVYNITNKIRANGDDSEEVKIAQFWDCNPYVSVNKGHFMFASKKITPGAHWIGICKIACKNTSANYEKTVFAYTKTSIAVADAFISCWDEKYRSNLIRPETIINKYIDDKWTPLLQTPPFPEYTSGHSVVSGASSEVLTAIFGDDFSFDDTTEIPYGLPIRKYTSFRNAAKEAAISRIYGGIHYNAAVVEGLKQGKNIGAFVNENLIFNK